MESNHNQKLELVYTLFCDDVRLEVGNKLSYMGVFQTIVVPQVPVWLPKLAVVNHWRGAGAHLSEVRVLMPDRQQALQHQADRYHRRLHSAGDRVAGERQGVGRPDSSPAAPPHSLPQRRPVGALRR